MECTRVNLSEGYGSAKRNLEKGGLSGRCNEGTKEFVLRK